MSFTTELDRIEKIRSLKLEFETLMARQSMIIVEIEQLGGQGAIRLKDIGDGTSEMAFNVDVGSAPMAAH